MFETNFIARFLLFRVKYTVIDRGCLFNDYSV